MFSFVQNYRILITIILGLIALTFVGFGVSGYGPTTEEPYLVKVGDARISQSDLDEVLREMPQPVDDKTKNEVLEQLIQQELILQEAKHNGIAISDQQIADYIGSIPALQENGKFSDKLYREFLQSRSWSAATFEKKIKKTLLLQTQISPIFNAQIVTKAQADLMARIFGEERVVRYAMFSPQNFAADIKLSDEALKKYYQDNLKRYRAPEAVKVQFVLLSQEGLADKVTVNDDELKKYYATHEKDFAQDKRRVAHILLAVPQGGSAADKAKIKAEAETILQAVKANPNQFAQVAKQRSEDPGSAPAGGDLGFVERGMMVKPFEDAAFKLNNAGEISGIVETEYGFHILKLEELQKANFDTAKTDVEKKLKMEKAATLYREKEKQLSDQAYNSDDLPKIAAALQLPTETSDWVARNRSADPRLGAPEVMEEIFSDEVLKKKHNSKLMKIGNNAQIVLRVVEHRPEKQLTFDEVKPMVTAELMSKEGGKLAQQRGAAALKTLNEGKEVADVQWAPEVTLSKKTPPPGLEMSELMKVFTASAKKLPTYVGMTRKDNSYLIFKIEAVKAAPSATPEELNGIMTALGQANTESQLSGYLAQLRKRFPVIKAVKSAQ